MDATEGSPPAGTALAIALDGATTTTDLGLTVAAHYGDVGAEHAALDRAAGVVDAAGHGVVHVHGPDAGSFLQSLVSADLDGVAVGAGTASLLLTPQGKLAVAFRALRVEEDAWWLDTDVGAGPTLAAALARYRIRVKADVEDRSSDHGVLSVRGPASADVVAAATGVAVPGEVHGHVAWRDGRVVRADWPDRAGVDVVGPLDLLADGWSALVDAGAVPAGRDAAERARIEAGVPRLGHDLGERTIPQEAFLERDAVSFTKGCFLGQELVCRIDTRGHVNRYLRRVRVEGARPPVGAEVVVDGRPVGTLTSVAAWAPDGAVALGYVRREVDPPAPVTVSWAEGTAPGTVESVR